MQAVSLSFLLSALFLQQTLALPILKQERDMNTFGRRQVSPTTWNPPSELVIGLQEVWDHQIETYNNGNALGFKNYGYDQLMANNGQLNYYVRWESTFTATVEDRANIESVLQRSVNQWINWLVDFDGFPYKTIPVKVVGWAVNDASFLEGDTSGITVYADKDVDGVPQCAESCGRFFHQDGDYSGCAVGAENHYGCSFSLLLTLSRFLIPSIPMKEQW